MSQVKNQTPQSVPLNKLEVAPENSRKTGVTARQDELKASLKAYGLLHPLLIRPSDKKGQFFVVDGQRRLLALKALVKDKALKSTFEVKCEHVDPEKALELSLTANAQVQTMHPADQFEAFYTMSQNSLSVGDIAARFGVSEKIVKQRLKLARVSPKLLDLYREGEMVLEHLEAFTLTDDHEKQETTWSELSHWQKNARHIKAMLTQTKVSAQDDRVKFVTLEAYQEAGGHAEYDLFSEDVYLTDLELLERLVTDKVAEAAKVVEAEGWAVVEVAPQYDYEFIQQFGRVYPEPVELSDKDASRMEIVESEIKAIHEAYDDADNSDELDQKLDVLEDELEQLVEKTEAFTTAQKAEGIAYVSYRNGEAFIIRGLVERKVLKNDAKKEPKPKKEISERLLERLTAHKTLALQDVLSNAPHIAFDLLVTEMVKGTFAAYSSQSFSCFHLNLTEPNLPADDESLTSSFAATNRQKAFEKWEKTLDPNNDEELYKTIASLTQDEKVKLLAFCFAGSLDAVIRPKEFVSKSQQERINQIAELLKLDMTQYWKPSASLYFNHVTKDSILNAVKEVKGLAVADTLKNLKKSDLAMAAEKRLENSNWLPKPLQVGTHQPDPA